MPFYQGLQTVSETLGSGPNTKQHICPELHNADHSVLLFYKGWSVTQLC
jgi:hypothetical protein